MRARSWGIICKLGEQSPEIVYSKDRVFYPLQRVGKKGTYEFERISWDEAHDIIVSKLNEIKAPCRVLKTTGKLLYRLTQ